MPLSASQVSPTMQRASIPAFPNGSMNAGELTLIFRIRHAKSKELLKEHRLILMPATMTQETEARTSIYYTKGGVFVDTPLENGVGLTVFTIAGHTGFRGVVAQGANPVADRLLGPTTPAAFVATVQSFVSSVRTGNSVPIPGSLIDGAAAIKDLQDCLLGYFYPQGQDETAGVTQTQDLQLEFLNLTAPTSAEDGTGQVGWRIHPHRNLVSLRQDASKPFLYYYQLQFAAIAPLTVDILDVFVNDFTSPRTGLQTTLKQITQVVTDVTNGVNTITDAFDQMVIQNVTGPITTFLQESANLGDALGTFIKSGADKLAFPLYAQRLASQVLDAPKHSVTTLAEAASALGALLIEAADPRSIGTLLAGTSLTGGTNDALTLRVNQEPSLTLVLGTQTSGTAIAAAIQAQVRAQGSALPSNAAAYRDFTATFNTTTGQYTLSSGTKLSPAGQVEVLVNDDPALTPMDASPTLGLGIAHGGQEHAGTDVPVRALALLRGVEQACRHLQAFPDYFATQLDAQDAQLARLLPAGVTRPQIRGDQRLRQTRITPGDSLQGIANRVGVPWETLALVNQLTYPFILDQSSTLRRGRVSSADVWSLTDVTQSWSTDLYQGQRVDIVAGAGAGQSGDVVRNTSTQLVLASAWTVLPNDTSDYAIRSNENPILHTGAVTSATARTLTDTALTLVAGSQRGLTVLLASGATAGERRRIVATRGTTYTLDKDWDVIPAAGTIYLLLRTETVRGRHQKLVGETLSVPQPSSRTPLPIRGRLQDVSAVTGRRLTTEEQLFGRDLLLQEGGLVWDAAAGDCATVAGLANLRQAMIHLINLPIGELDYQPGLGSFVQEELGLTATLPLQIQLLASVERTIRQDRRIARMNGAQLNTQGGETLISFGATAINGATVARVTIK